VCIVPSLLIKLVLDAQCAAVIQSAGIAFSVRGYSVFTDQEMH
jgi:hypothetical protein